MKPSVVYLISAVLCALVACSSQDPNRCLPDVVYEAGGKVVIYDLVVSVPGNRLYLFGPHEKLWVVPTVPKLQENTVFFPHYFDRGSNGSGVAGSNCVFSMDGEDGGQTLMDFILDPLKNINSAFCALPDGMTSKLQDGSKVSVTVTLQGQHEAVVLTDLPVCVPPFRPPVYASLCCIVRNEARYLVEWIEYSRMIGIEHFFLYDHESTDDMAGVLSPYIDAQIVTLHNWSFPGYPQREVHSHCTFKYGHLTTWLGLMDVDEFIVPVRSSSFLNLLHFFDQEPAILRLSALQFGTSGHTTRPDGLVTEHYTWRNLSSKWPHTPQHKFWFKPGGLYVVLPSIHAVDLAADHALRIDIHEHDAYYNHYRTKSGQDHSEDPLRKHMPIMEAAEVQDLRLKGRFLAQLKARLALLPATVPPAPVGADVGGRSSRQPAAGTVLSFTFASDFEECPALAESFAVLFAAPPPPSSASFQSERQRARSDEAKEEEEELEAVVSAFRPTLPVLDLDCGSGYYTAELRARGFQATGLDPDGTPTSLLQYGVREVNAWRRGAFPRDMPKGHVLVSSLPSPPPSGFDLLLENGAAMVEEREGRLILGWNGGGVGGSAVDVGWGVAEKLFEGGLEVNVSETQWLQEQAASARHNTRKLASAMRVLPPHCQGQSLFLVFAPIRPELRSYALASAHGQPKCKAAATAVWPSDGDAVLSGQTMELEVWGGGAPFGWGVLIYIDGVLVGHSSRAVARIPTPPRAGQHVLGLVGVCLGEGMTVGEGRETRFWLRDSTAERREEADAEERAAAVRKMLEEEGEGDGQQCAEGQCRSVRVKQVREKEREEAGAGEPAPEEVLELEVHGMEGGTAYSLDLALHGTTPDSPGFRHRFHVLSPATGQRRLRVQLPRVRSMGPEQVLLEAEGTVAVRTQQSHALIAASTFRYTWRGNRRREADQSAALFCRQFELGVWNSLPHWAQVPLTPGLSDVVASGRAEWSIGSLRVRSEAGGSGVVSFVMGKEEGENEADWVYVRAVGDAGVAVGRVERVARGWYAVRLWVPAPGSYWLQAVSAWRSLPADLVGKWREEKEVTELVRGMAGQQTTHLVSELADASSFIGHVTVPTVANETKPHHQRDAQTKPLCSASGGGLHEGAWRRRAAAGAHGEKRAEDECGVVGGAWEWESEQCTYARFSERTCEACLTSRLRGITFIGDSNCRDLYVEAVTCVVGDWRPDLPVARERTRHSNSSIALARGGHLAFVWCKLLDEVVWAARERVEALQAAAFATGDERAADKAVIVIGIAVWDMVVHLTSLQEFKVKLQPLLDLLAEFEQLGGVAVWLSPISRTLMKKAGLPGELDVRIGQWRISRWAHQLAALMLRRGVKVVDSFHAGDALHEAFDGNHLGIACGWANTDGKPVEPGSRGVCRLNGRILARNVLDMLLGTICAAAPPPAFQRVQRVAVKVGEVEGLEQMVADVTVSVRVGQAEADAGGGPARDTEEADEEEEEGLEEEGAVGDGARAGAAEGAGERGEQGQGEAGAGAGEWELRREWDRGAVAEVRFRWCVVCVETNGAMVMVDDMLVNYCQQDVCAVPLRRLAPGPHELLIAIADLSDAVVSSSRFSFSLPWSDAISSNVALSSLGARAEALYSQGHFLPGALIDGITAGENNGWAYHGQMERAVVMVLLAGPALVQRVVVVSGAERPDHHVTEFMLSYSNHAAPEIEGAEWLPLPLNQTARPAEEVHVREGGHVTVARGVAEVELRCDYVEARALRLRVLGSDADNNNAVVTELLVYAI